MGKKNANTAAPSAAKAPAVVPAARRRKGHAASSTPPSKLPVTLLSGFLGSGKTSLLRHVLNNREGLRVAVILNEISEINIDVLALQGAKILQTDEKVVEMSNGCICCTLREDLLKTLRSLHQQRAFDAVLIESSGIAEPMQVAETFFIDLGDGTGPLQEVAPLHNCVTVVDASTVKAHLNDPRAAIAIDPKAKEEKEDQSIGELLIQQIEFANVVVLNKLDLLTGANTLDGALANNAAAIGEVTSLIRSINPSAVIVPAVHGTIPTREILAAPRFTEAWAKGVAGWMEDIQSGINHVPETLEYGIGSYLYTADRPFHPSRLHEWIDALFFWNEIAFEEVEEPDDEEEGEEGEEGDAENAAQPVMAPSPPADAVAGTSKGNDRKVDVDVAPINADGIQEFGADEKRLRDATYGNFFRSKGFVWLGNPDRVEHVMEWSQAGTVLNMQYASAWKHFSTQERGQRLVFIGQGINKDQLKKDLDALLLTDEEWKTLQAGGYDQTPLPDPFEPFPQSALEEEDAAADTEGAPACSLDHHHHHGHGHSHSHGHHHHTGNHSNGNEKPKKANGKKRQRAEE